MEIRYYIPTIEDFYQGVEYEVYIGERTCYSQEVFYLNESHLNLVRQKLASNEIRIKYLDKEDMKELGWISNGSGWYDLNKVPGSLPYFTHVKFKEWGKQTAIIAYRGEPKTATEDQHLFVGEIKNKSDLKKIMIQLQIYEKPI